MGPPVLINGTRYEFLFLEPVRVLNLRVAYFDLVK